jgi:hypothetical protein
MTAVQFCNVTDAAAVAALPPPALEMAVARLGSLYMRRRVWPLTVRAPPSTPRCQGLQPITASRSISSWAIPHLNGYASDQVIDF